MTPEQQAQAQAHMDRTLMRVLLAPTKDERMMAARELTIMPPAEHEEETRIVLRCVRTPPPEGQTKQGWCAVVEGGEGILSIVFKRELSEIVSFFAGVAKLVTSPHVTDDELAMEGDSDGQVED